MALELRTADATETALRLRIEQVKEDAVFDMMASIRNMVRNLPEARRREIFADFGTAVQLNDLGYLADTIANWAAGGHGYEDRGITVNKTADDLPDIQSNPVLKEVWQDYLRTQEDDSQAD
jgi:hypothetical protein